MDIQLTLCAHNAVITLTNTERLALVKVIQERMAIEHTPVAELVIMQDLLEGLLTYEEKRVLQP